MTDTAERTRIVRLRRIAKRRGYVLQKTRRFDPLAVDYGTWMITGPGAPRGLLSTDEVESFLAAPPKIADRSPGHPLAAQLDDMRAEMIDLLREIGKLPDEEAKPLLERLAKSTADLDRAVSRWSLTLANAERRTARGREGIEEIPNEFQTPEPLGYDERDEG